MFLFFLILFIPTQLGRHFWPEWSYVWGIRIDYLSPVLYFLDLLWLGWIGCGALNKRKIKVKFDFKWVVFVLFVLVNVLMAQNRWVAIYKWFRVGQLVITWMFLQTERKKVERYLIMVIPFWVVVESLLGLVQIINGASMNGWAYYLGERRFAYTTFGVAQMSIMGRGLVRAYGTFSHPNSLAGFLLVTLMIWMWRKKDINRVFWWAITWLLVVGIVISGSRMVWVLTLLMILMTTYKQSKDRKKVVGFGVALVGVFLLIVAMVSVNYRSGDFLGGWDREGVNKRISLNMSAIRMIRSNPLFGIGLGNFVVKLPDIQKDDSYFWLQPVHNIGLLLMSEVGFLGLIWIFLALSNLKWRRLDYNQKWIWMVVLLTGMSDHYWLTLPQNIWLVLILMVVL